MWIKTKALFRPPDIEDLVYEHMNRQERLITHEERSFRFDSERLVSYNETLENNTTIHLIDGYEITIVMTFDELDKILEYKFQDSKWQ